MSKKTKAQELQEQLTWSAPHIGKDAPDHKEKAFKYCEGYKKFLNAGKTERAVSYTHLKGRRLSFSLYRS